MTRPHDLLRLRRLPDADADALPDWVTTALTTTPWVVVRRATAPPGLLAVGVRGPTRAQRWALTVPAGDVAEARTPESLVPARSTEINWPVAPRSVIEKGVDGRLIDVGGRLRQARGVLDGELPGRWGPTGSVGFTLATGAVVVTPTSDLDLLLRPAVVDLDRLRALHEALGPEVDAQVETPVGAVALAELVSGAPAVLARTPRGPELVPVPA